MTSSHFDSSGPASAPPPGCPAHGLDAGALEQLVGSHAAADPTGFYEKLRKRYGAVAPVRLPGDLPAWLVLGHRANLEVTRNPSKFARNPKHWTYVRNGTVNATHQLGPILLPPPVPICTHSDGEEHKRLRGAITDSINGIERRGMRTYVQRYANELIDEFSAAGSADLVSQYAELLPLRVMAKLLGMPDEHGPEMAEAARDMVMGTESSAASNQYVTDVLEQLVRDKRRTPGADIASYMIAHGAHLDDASIRENLRTVLIAAYRTTANLIASTLREVLTNRNFRGELGAGGMTMPEALLQMLWDNPPFAVLPGYSATADTELFGKQIAEGDLLILGLAAGNMDPDIRDLNDPVTGNRSHLAFSSGPHECPGQDIGLGIAEGGIDALLERLPDLKLGVAEEELEVGFELMERPLLSLPVEFSPHRPRGLAAAGARDARPAPQTTPSTPPAGQRSARRRAYAR